MRGRDDDVFIAPQTAEPDLFGRHVSADELELFRARHGIGTGPIVLYVGRLVPEKGIPVLLDAWPQVARRRHAGADRRRAAGRERLARRRASASCGPIPRPELPVAYAAAELAVLPSVPTPRFREPWGLVCNEAMLQGRPVIATDAVGAAAGGLVRDGQDGLVVPAGDAVALARRDRPAAGRPGVARAARDRGARRGGAVHLRRDGGGLSSRRWRWPVGDTSAPPARRSPRGRAPDYCPTENSASRSCCE